MIEAELADHRTRLSTQGRNERGEVGLFPQSYTSSRPPSFFPSEGGDQADSPVLGGTAASTVSPPTPTLAHDEVAPPLPHDAPVQHETLSPTLGSQRRDSVSDASLHSQVDDEDDEAPVQGLNGVRPADGAAHRAALAAKAMENAEREAQEERERAERRRREDEERYEKRKSGFIEGLQLSDESDDDEPEPEVAPVLTTRLDEPVEEVEELRDESIGRQSVDETGSSLVRPRADTQASTYAESVYSNASSAPPIPSPPVPGAANAPSPSIALAASEPSPSTALAPEPASIALPASPAIEATESSAAEPVEAPATKGDETPRSGNEASPDESAGGIADTLKAASESTAGVLTAGAAGLVAAVGAAAAATGVALQGDDDKAREVAPVSQAAAMQSQEEELAAPVEATAALDSDATATAAAPPPPDETAVPVEVPARAATPVQATAADAAVESAPAVESVPVAAAASQPAAAPPVLVDSARATTPPAALSAPLAQPVSPASLDQSRASTPATSAAPLSSSVVTGATTATASTSEQGEAKELPADPMTWNVDEVVAWGKQKGFDALTVGKFAEHEISGDVLLEMDVAMLKEIDLIAFGRRVHIFNAIKELRLRTQPPRPTSALNTSHSTSGGSFLSPALSGYEPDSPTNYTPGSPTAAYLHQTPQMRWEQQQHDRNPGLGFEDDSAPASLRSPSSLGQQSVSNLRSSRSIPSSVEGATPSVPHTRSTTVDSVKSTTVAPEPVVAKAIPEEPVAEEGGSTTEGDLARKPKSRPSTASSLRPRSSRRTADKGAGEGSATSTPPSPALGSSQERKLSKSEKGSFFGTALPLPGRNRKPPPRVPSCVYPFSRSQRVVADAQAFPQSPPHRLGRGCRSPTPAQLVPGPRQALDAPLLVVRRRLGL